jgi:drug/metabolite transporter (DMT)-like permease
MAGQGQSEVLRAPAPSRPIRGYLFIAAAALCWGVSATLGRAVFTGRLGDGQAPIGPLILAQSRTTISLLVLAPLLLLRRGRAGMSMPRRDLLRALWVGVAGVAGSNYFYYLAIQKTNVATAIILQYVAPVWVLLYMVARRLQRATAQRVVAVLMAVVGSALVVGAGSLRLDAVGVIAAELAAITFAYYNVAIPPLLTRHDRWKVLVYLLLGAALCWQVVNPPWRIAAAHYSSQQWGFLALFAVTSVLLPFSLYIAGLQYLDATRAIVTSALEPVFSIIIAAVALGEMVRPTQVVGIVVVLAATLVVQWPERREPVAVVEPME